MNLPIEFHPEVRGEVDDAFRWYEKQRPGLGAEFLDAVRITLIQIRERPDAPQVIQGGVRRTRTRRFPFKIVYKLEDERIWILAVQHAQRDPSNWKARV